MELKDKLILVIYPASAISLVWLYWNYLDERQQLDFNGFLNATYAICTLPFILLLGSYFAWEGMFLNPRNRDHKELIDAVSYLFLMGFYWLIVIFGLIPFLRAIGRLFSHQKRN